MEREARFNRKPSIHGWEEMSEIKPCKIHGTMPYLKEIETDTWVNTYSILGPIKQFKYACHQCEWEAEASRKKPMIDEWNKKQEES